MDTTPSRRSVLKTIGVVGIAGLAGCGGGGGDPATEAGTSTAAGTDTEMDGGDGASGSTDAFSYTFQSGDGVVGSSLNGLEFNYPDGSGALTDVTIAGTTLAGTDVSVDVSGTEILNQGDTLIVTLGGEYSISEGDQLAVELAGVTASMDSYEVDITVNPQSGATTFFQSF